MATESAIQTTQARPVEVRHGSGRRASWTYRPNVDIFDTADEFLLLADLPGADPERIDVVIESGVLTVQADVLARDHGSAQCVAHEYGVGGYHRRFEVDESIDADAVRAEYRDGVLTVHVPKAAQARRRRVPVST